MAGSKFEDGMKDEDTSYRVGGCTLYDESISNELENKMLSGSSYPENLRSAQ